MTLLRKCSHLVAATVCVLGAASTPSYGSGPDELAYRLFAHVWVDVSRQVCASEESEVKRRLEAALQSSGLLELSVDNLCAGGICGDRTPKDLRLEVTLKGMREEHRRMYERKSPAEQHADCLKFTSMFEKMRGGAGKVPEQIYEGFLKNME
mgnify:CR=1 FL=1